MKKIILLIITIPLLLSCQSQTTSVSSTAILIEDVNIVDVTQARILSGSHVVIDSGLIKKITAQAIDPEGYTKHIDGGNMYLMPGLAEMHAHIPGPNTSRKRLEETLFLYLSNGITTIRGMLGHEMHLKLKEEVAQGDILGPRIYTSSPSLNGNTVKSPQEAREKVMEYAKAGFDFLKIHPGIQRNVFDTLVATARAHNIPFAGHVPVDVGIRHALESGFASIDHLDGYLEGLVPPEKELDPTTNGFFGFNFTDETDFALIGELIQLTRDREVWAVPTQSLFERWYAPTDVDELLAQPEMKYMPASILDQWKSVKMRSTGPESDFDPNKWERFISIRRQLLKSLYDGGHGMILGSDAPQLFNVPGFSIHHEIQGMLRAGLNPIQILATGTYQPARYFNQTNVFGQVKEGFEADLILLSKNPFSNIENLKAIEGVFVRGRWLDKKMIEDRLADIAKNAAEN